MPQIFAEYIWIDGTKPTARVRSKTRVLDRPKIPFGTKHSLPDWSFDGSSTNQAPGSRSDCVLRPCYAVRDPLRPDGAHCLVLCEVFLPDGVTPHPTNTRAKLRQLIGLPEAATLPFAEYPAEQIAEMMACWFGLEQEYTLMRAGRPLGFPDKGFPGPQGPYYCGVGADEVVGRDLVEEHMRLCVQVGLKISGVNAEVMPGQWEFQVGPLGPVEVGDQLWLARWLLYRLGEKYDISATLDPKPAKGDWNGAGCHTNFSTQAMREDGGMAHIVAYCESAATKREEHLAAYGAGYEQRLTGAHETCSYREFKWGVSDRTASIRVPLQAQLDGKGYLEDRRPNANCDPYEVATVTLKTAFNLW